MSAPTGSAFTAVVLDPQGHIATRRIDATSVEQARQIAASGGHTVLECGPHEAAGARSSLLGRLTLTGTSSIDTVAFSQDLATLMEAGVTVKEGVDALARREDSPARRQVLSRLNDAMAEGLSLSAALE